MAIKSKTLALPEEIEPHCPKCGQRCRTKVPAGLNDCVYECGDCGMQFEAVIELSWNEDEK